MSKYNTFDEVRFKDRDCLVAALGELGYGPETIEEGAGLHLFGYAGDRRPEIAELVIRRRHVGGASNDLGFRRGEDGTYVPIVSDYDVGYLARRHAAAPGETFLAKLQVAYDYQGALAFARRQERLLHRRVAVRRQLTGDRQRIVVVVVEAGGRARHAAGDVHDRPRERTIGDPHRGDRRPGLRPS